MRVYHLTCKKRMGKEVLEEYPDIQAVDAGLVAGKDHLEYAVEQAEKAFKRGTNICSDPKIEALVRASAQRQIKKALELFGVNNSREVYVLCEKLPSGILKKYDCVEDSSDDITRDKYEALKKAFNVEDAEISAVSGDKFEERLKALKSIIKERIALLETL